MSSPPNRPATCFTRLLLMGLLMFVGACASDELPYPIATLEPSEVFPGGDTTNRLLIMGSNAFIRPASNLSPENEAFFYSGNGWFNQNFVEAPASALTRDGLGPFFNAESCSGCHFKDGRGKALSGDGNDPLGVLFRLSIPGLAEHGTVIPDPTYGDQLQPFGILHVPAEARMQVQWEEVPATYADGTSFSLRKPTYDITDFGYGQPDEELLLSPRVAPFIIGMGLLEAISEQDLLNAADPNDVDQNGISGRINYVWSVQLEEKGIGRFGWKAEQPTVRQQSAAALSGDLGVTSSLFPDQNCTEAQVECAEAMTGGEPELEDHILDRIEVYTQSVAVPIRRNWDKTEVLRGKLIFNQIGCADCHTPSYVTGTASSLSEMHEQTIWPYTDLLLHDMGEALADNRPIFDATGSEWRTPPLWGLGLIPTVNKHDHLLHDGRARGFAEAILWHGGEAEQSKESFRTLSSAERQAVISFLESL